MRKDLKKVIKTISVVILISSSILIILWLFNKEENKVCERVFNENVSLFTSQVDSFGKYVDIISKTKVNADEIKSANESMLTIMMLGHLDKDQYFDEDMLEAHRDWESKVLEVVGYAEHAAQNNSITYLNEAKSKVYWTDSFKKYVESMGTLCK